jgi:hypothetical protein
VCRFYKGALFNITHLSLLPALVFGTQMQSTTALNVTAIVFDTLQMTTSSPLNWTFVALALLLLAIFQSVYCLHPARVQFSLSNMTNRRCHASNRHRHQDCI